MTGNQSQNQQDLFGTTLVIDHIPDIPSSVCDFLAWESEWALPVDIVGPFLNWLSGLDYIKSGPQGLLEACSNAEVNKKIDNWNVVVTLTYVPFVNPKASFHASTRSLSGVSIKMTEIVRAKLASRLPNIEIVLERAHPTEIAWSPFKPDFIARIYDQLLITPLDEAHLKISLCDHPDIRIFPKRVARALLDPQTRIIRSVWDKWAIKFSIHTGVPFRPESESEWQFRVMTEQRRFEDTIAKLLQFWSMTPDVDLSYWEPEKKTKDDVLPLRAVDLQIVKPLNPVLDYTPPLLLQPILEELKDGKVRWMHYIRQTHLAGWQEQTFIDEIHRIADWKKMKCYDFDCTDMKKENWSWWKACRESTWKQPDNPIDEFFDQVLAKPIPSIIVIRNLETAFPTVDARKQRTLPRIMAHLERLKTGWKHPIHKIIVLSSRHKNQFLHEKEDELTSWKEDMAWIVSLHRMMESIPFIELDSETQSYQSREIRRDRMAYRLHQEFPAIADGADVFEFMQERHRQRLNSLPAISESLSYIFQRITTFETFLWSLHEKKYEFDMAQLTHLILTEKDNCDFETFFNEFFINWVTIRIAKFYPEYIEPDFSGDLEKLDETSVDTDDLLTEEGSIFRAYVLANSLLHMFPAKFPEMEKHREKWFKEIFAHVPGIGAMKLSSFLANLEEILNGKVAYQYTSTLSPEEDTLSPEEDESQTVAPSEEDTLVPINPDLERLLSRNRARRSDFLRHVYTLGIEPFSAQEAKIS